MQNERRFNDKQLDLILVSFFFSLSVSLFPTIFLIMSFLLEIPQCEEKQISCLFFKKKKRCNLAENCKKNLYIFFLVIFTSTILFQNKHDNDEEKKNSIFRLSNHNLNEINSIYNKMKRFEYLFCLIKSSSSTEQSQKCCTRVLNCVTILS